MTSSERKQPHSRVSQNFFALFKWFQIAWICMGLLVAAFGAVGLAVVREPIIGWVVVFFGSILMIPVGVLFLRYVRHRLEQLDNPSK